MPSLHSTIPHRVQAHLGQPLAQLQAASSWPFALQGVRDTDLLQVTEPVVFEHSATGRSFQLPLVRALALNTDAALVTNVTALMPLTPLDAQAVQALLVQVAEKLKAAGYLWRRRYARDAAASEAQALQALAAQMSVPGAASTEAVFWIYYTAPPPAESEEIMLSIKHFQPLSRHFDAPGATRRPTFFLQLDLSDEAVRRAAYQRAVATRRALGRPAFSPILIADYP